MAGSIDVKWLIIRSFVLAFAVGNLSLSGLHAQPDPETRPAPEIETAPAPEIEDDVLTPPPFGEEFDDDFNEEADDFLNDLQFGDPQDEPDPFATEPTDAGSGEFRRADEIDRFRRPPSSLRDEVDMPARELPEGEDGFGLDLTRDEEDTEVEEQKPKRASIRALEKITARITDLDIDVGETAQFKGLMITVRTCNKRPPEETPETTAFLEVVEQKPNGDSEQLFTGWMFASSPGLSALEHPVYDVWVMDCKTLDPVQSSGME